MKISLKILFLTFAGVVWSVCCTAQDRYSDYRTMMQKINTLSGDYPALCTSRSLAKTAGGKEVIVITIGTGDKENKPGIAIFGGIEGSHILGRELALGFASSILKESESSEIKALLGKVTFYVFPDVSPDAAEQFFAGLKYERIFNSAQTDDDRDFLNEEDPFEDLNSDGLITLIRVSDPAGTYSESDEDKRVMVPADLSKGQTGSFFVYSEGIDNDKDQKFNEDGPGGVSFNRNLTYNYEEFGINAGLYPVSEVETKAVLDFLFDHFNIYVTFAFGPQDNLGQPMRATERSGSAQTSAQTQMPAQGQFPPTGQMPVQGQMRMTGQQRKITSILNSDEVINKLVSDKYHEITGIKGAPASRTPPGNFMEWSYFHYGRYSFSTPAWWFPAERDKNAEVAFLKYADENKMDDVFVPWTEIKHPDFPDKKTEAGGIKPFATINPPAEKLGELVSNNYKFIVAIAAMHPELEFLDVNVENKGDNIYRLSLKVHNKGIFATCSEAGEVNMWTRIMRISLETSGSQKFLSGQKTQRIQRLEGDQSAEFSWLINGKGSIKITAGAVNTGMITTSVELK
ncbi:MAG: peptidase [Bacteroidales bacterium]|nr:peptidase [Bacteroidales bacterium]